MLTHDWAPPKAGASLRASLEHSSTKHHSPTISAPPSKTQTKGPSIF